jgi:PIN domain nuclease of toxin-antitoxin system
MLVAHGRLRFRQQVTEWVDAALERPKIELLSFSPSSAVRAAGFSDGFPGDPADRFIVAAALEMGAPLVTGDQTIAAWGGIDVLW